MEMQCLIDCFTTHMRIAGGGDDQQHLLAACHHHIYCIELP